MELEWTGERVVPEKMSPKNGMLLEHIARYKFSLKFARGEVIDIACGAGYGSKMLAESTKVRTVLGVDISSEVVEYARQNYYHHKINYRQADVVDPHLSAKLGKFDTVVSFETMEHVSRENVYLENMRELAKPEGTIIISTPFGRGRGEPCNDPYHVHQLTVQEFEETITKFFSCNQVDFYHQRDTSIELPQAEKKYYLGIAVIST